MKHIPQIKKAIGIESVYAGISMWRYRPKEKDELGAQIDLIIDRNDSCINLCEIKFSSSAFEINKSYSKELDNKLNVFQQRTGTRKSLFLTMITTYGVKNLINYPGLIQKEVTMDVLFN